MTPLRILVACEQSGHVRAALRRRGHDAYSCDLAPARDSGPHLLGDALDYLAEGWDMIIAFPPCTYLTRASAFRWDTTTAEQIAATAFARRLAEAAPQTAIENPHGRLATLWRPPDQVVHPWWFGHPWTKPTCLWLHNLPPLMATLITQPTRSWVRTNCPGSKNRAYRKSITPTGLAEAMARQWTPDLTQETSL